jgi:hypothetical protein
MEKVVVSRIGGFIFDEFIRLFDEQNLLDLLCELLMKSETISIVGVFHRIFD